MASNPAPTTGDAPIPRHVAIIMDGNGRWAKARRLPRLAGHKQGVEAVRRVSRAARELGVEVLTLYAFSSENWRRPAEEVGDLMGLMRHFIKSDLAELVSENVRLRVIGDYRRFSPDTVKLIEHAVKSAGSTDPAALQKALEATHDFPGVYASYSWSPGERNGFPEDVRRELKRAYRLFFKSELNLSQARERAERELRPVPEIKEFLAFFERSDRGSVI